MTLFSAKGSEFHTHCIIGTSICAIAAKQLARDYLLHCFEGSYILVWEITAQNISTVRVKCLGHIDWAVW